MKLRLNRFVLNTFRRIREKNKTKADQVATMVQNLEEELQKAVDIDTWNDAVKETGVRSAGKEYELHEYQNADNRSKGKLYVLRKRKQSCCE